MSGDMMVDYVEKENSNGANPMHSEDEALRYLAEILVGAFFEHKKYDSGIK